MIEGWNEGWDGDWFANGEAFSFTRPYPDFDLKAVTDYARQKGVHLIGHHETSANIANYEAQLGDALDLYARLGVDSVKTGYVADAGGVKTMGIHKPWSPSRSYGLVVRLDADLRPVASFHSRANGKRHGITSVVEANGRVLAASKGGDALLEIDWRAGSEA